ncbi:MAG: fasciclin domain-containing protein [Bacteroidales bacterium]|nr:fasciclin domain-containing protein [Bacteroidales bacterium]
MEKGFWKQWFQLIPVAGILLAGSVWLVSCNDEYAHYDIEPEWLGASIYDYLKTEGTYSYFSRLIDDVGYTEILSQTGSKTLFVADDAAFERFFQDNHWGVTSYDNLSMAQKKLIINFAMINNAYLIETLSNYFDGGLQLGAALRRTTAISVLDTIPFESGEMLPAGSLWEPYRNGGIYLLKDATSWPIVHFLQSSLENAGITNSDFSLITGVDRIENDAHVFNIRVAERDITCKNGYIHVLEEVLIPPVNIAQHIHKNPDTRIFSGLLERFCAPYYNSAQTNAYNQIHPDRPIDSIFEKQFFASYDGADRYPNGRVINTELLLPFNPGRNSYVRAGNALQSDMAAILCPTDEAMTDYFEAGSGLVLKDRYGSWENIPDDIVMLLLKRHLRESFIETVPSRFSKMNDSENSPIPISTSDVTASYVGVNGVVYMTEKVYPPDDYVSVYGPVLFSEKTRVFNWAIRRNDFRLYLNSLVSRYSFFVPTDEFFRDYIDPVAYAKDVQGVMKYWYNDETGTVNATVYRYDPLTGETGDSVNVITNADFLANRLLDLLDTHVVIGDVESGSLYYFTKNGNSLRVEGNGNDLKVQGGYDIRSGVRVNVIPEGVFEQQNGITYFIDKPIQAPLHSVYKTLSETPEFSKFFSLLSDFTGTSMEVFVKKTNYYGIDFNIKFFNTFNYTVYVPTNEAIQQAIDDGLISDWATIDTISDPTLKTAAMKKLERFLRYHFQDNSVYISGEPVNRIYQTATIKTNELETQFGTYKDKYYRLGITGDGNSLTLSTENYGTASVVTGNGLYNIMTRDYIFNDNPLAYKEVDGTGAGKEFATSAIFTSSTAVIHQIDNVLRFE